MSHRLYIKNMVCPRCVKVVKDTLDGLNIDNHQVQLGEVSLSSALNQQLLLELAQALEKEGFSLLTEKNAQLVEKVKHLIIAFVQDPQAHPQALRMKFSQYLAQELGQDYSSLSQLFSAVTGITIEKYLIAQKIERVKELLKYGELNLTQIAEVTDYSSVQYLSNQFKRVTGMSPRQFRQLNPARTGIDI